MTRLLRTTSGAALAAASATVAEAADREIAVGGYFETYAAYAAPDADGIVDGEFDRIDNKIEPEIHFQPSITLDNGLTIGADVQLEGTTTGGRRRVVPVRDRRRRRRLGGSAPAARSDSEPSRAPDRSTLPRPEARARRFFRYGRRPIGVKRGRTTKRRGTR
jgi:hypothetical protein